MEVINGHKEGEGYEEMILRRFQEAMSLNDFVMRKWQLRVTVEVYHKILVYKEAFNQAWRASETKPLD